MSDQELRERALIEMRVCLGPWATNPSYPLAPPAALLDRAVKWAAIAEALRPDTQR